MTSQILLRSLSRTRTSFPRMLFSTAPATKPASAHDNESFLTGTSSLYAEQMYENYLQNPDSVHDSWKTYFANVDNGVKYVEGDFSSPTAVPPTKKRQNVYVAVSALPSSVYLCICISSFPHLTHGRFHSIRLYKNYTTGRCPIRLTRSLASHPGLPSQWTHCRPTRSSPPPQQRMLSPPTRERSSCGRISCCPFAPISWIYRQGLGSSTSIQRNKYWWK